jgi:transposase
MERMAMSRTKEVLRLRWALELSVREVSRATRTSTGVISKTESRARAAGLTWSEVEVMSEIELERRLYGGPKHYRGPDRPAVDAMWIHRELRRAGVTLELLHMEYLQQHPDGYRYTAFCDHYRRWLDKQNVTMRQVHKAGEKLFVDYSGKQPRVVDPATGEVVAVELFVGVLGASNFTYAEATATQKIPDFIGSHVRALEYFGGSPVMLVPDQLRSAVSAPSRLEPTVNRAYAELGAHYGTAVVPARPRKPRDKAKVEVGVQIAQRWILARIRNETFMSLGALNSRIRELLEELNDRPMKKFGGVTRRQLFERYERAALTALPSDRYIVSEWKAATVAPDYHIALHDHYYSVPFVLVRETVEARMTSATVEIFHRGERIASHARSVEKYRHTTDLSHMPEAHRVHFGGGDDLLEWSAKMGPMTHAMMQRILESNPVREVCWRSGKGLQRLCSKYGVERVEAACERALHLGAHSYKPIERILRLGRDEMALPGQQPEERASIVHDNVRGPNYYH